MLGQTKQKSENPPSYYTSHQRAIFTKKKLTPPPLPPLFSFSLSVPQKNKHIHFNIWSCCLQLMGLPFQDRSVRIMLNNEDFYNV